MDNLALVRESPLTPDLELLFMRHTQAMHADTPPESIHMMPRTDLERRDIAFFVLRDGGRAVGMGALKHIALGHAEIKSMHVLTEERGRGLAVYLLEGLIAHARSQGLTRLSLETGTQPSFAPAQKLYSRAGFRECAPFLGYTIDPNSLYMTICWPPDS